MKLFTKAQYTQLLKNGSPENRGKDHKPVAHLYKQDSYGVWLISEIDSENPDIAFGICDTDGNKPELGYISISSLREYRGPCGLPIKSHLNFEGEYPLSIYLKAAKFKGFIFTHDCILRDM